MPLGRIIDYAGGLNRAVEATYKRRQVISAKQFELAFLSRDELISHREELFTEAASLVDAIMAAPESNFLGTVAVSEEMPNESKREIKNLVPGLGTLVIGRIKENMPKQEAKERGHNIFWREVASITVPNQIASTFNEVESVAAVSLQYPAYPTPGQVAVCEAGLEAIRTVHDVWVTTETLASTRAAQ